MQNYFITFSGITLANRNQLERNLTGRCGITWHAPCKHLAPSTKRAQNGGENHFYKFFVTKTMHHFTHFLTTDFHEIWTQNMNRFYNEFFWSRIATFCWQEVIYPEKPHFLVFLGYTSVARASAFAFTVGLQQISTANLSTASYIYPTTKDVCPQWGTFFVQLTVFEI